MTLLKAKLKKIEWLDVLLLVTVVVITYIEQLLVNGH